MGSNGSSQEATAGSASFQGGHNTTPTTSALSPQLALPTFTATKGTEIEGALAAAKNDDKIKTVELGLIFNVLPFFSTPVEFRQGFSSSLQLRICDCIFHVRCAKRREFCGKVLIPSGTPLMTFSRARPHLPHPIAHWRSKFQQDLRHDLNAIGHRSVVIRNSHTDPVFAATHTLAFFRSLAEHHRNTFRETHPPHSERSVQPPHHFRNTSKGADRLDSSPGRTPSRTWPQSTASSQALPFGTPAAAGQTREITGRGHEKERSACGGGGGTGRTTRVRNRRKNERGGWGLQGLQITMTGEQNTEEHPPPQSVVMMLAVTPRSPRWRTGQTSSKGKLAARAVVIIFTPTIPIRPDQSSVEPRGLPCHLVYF